MFIKKVLFLACVDLNIQNNNGQTVEHDISIIKPQTMVRGDVDFGTMLMDIRLYICYDNLPDTVIIT